MNIEELSVLMAIAGICIGAVNIITEVLKAMFLKVETNKPLVVFIVSEAVCAVAFYAYSVIYGVNITPLMCLGSIVGGFLISYGAMYGYDKLYGNFFKSIESIYKKEKE